MKEGRERRWKERKGRGGEERTVPIVPVLRKYHWYGADHGAHTDTLHTGTDLLRHWWISNKNNICLRWRASVEVLMNKNRQQSAYSSTQCILFNCINVLFGIGLAVLLWSRWNFDVCRLNDFKVSDSDCWHHDQNCAASPVVLSSLFTRYNCSTTNSTCILYYYTVAEMHLFL